MVSDELQAVISEYQMLRGEIQRRSTDQMHCLMASVASVGALISLTAQNPNKYSLILIVIPWILAVFGIIWLDHNRSIFLLGQYIRDEIEGKKLPKLLGSSEIRWMGWQHYISREREKKQSPSYIVSVLPFIYFIIPSIVCVVAYAILNLSGYTSVHGLAGLGLFLIGIIPIVLLLHSWYISYDITRKN